MKTLVIHPDDRTTDFLKAIYEGLDFKVINLKISEVELEHQISSHDRVIFLGHGCSWGLLGWSDLAFHGDMIPALNNNSKNIFIWCNADQFVAEYDLLGFHTGMFISEPKEAVAYNIKTEEQKIEYSNDLFSKTLRNVVLDQDPHSMYEHMRKNYSSKSCPVIHFNNERLYYTFTEELNYEIPATRNSC